MRFGKERCEELGREDFVGVDPGPRSVAARAPLGKDANASAKHLAREHGAPARRRSAARLAGATRARGHPPVTELDTGAKFASAPRESIEQVLRDGSPGLTQQADQVHVAVEVVEQTDLARGAGGRLEGLARADGPHHLVELGADAPIFLVVPASIWSMKLSLGAVRVAAGVAPYLSIAVAYV